MTNLEKLEALKWRATRYEAVLEHNGARYLIGYTAMHSRHGLLKVAQAHGQQIIGFLGVSADQEMTAGKRAADGFRIGDSAIRFTGRTQRDAILEGELQPIPSAARAVA